MVREDRGPYDTFQRNFPTKMDEMNHFGFESKRRQLPGKPTLVFGVTLMMLGKLSVIYLPATVLSCLG